MSKSSFLPSVIRAVAFLLFTNSIAISVYAASDSMAETNTTFYNVRFVKNYDGDSITFDIPDTPAIVGKNIVIRLRGIDTPEINKKSCPRAKTKAIQAKQMVYSLLKGATVINLHRIQRGKYFRILADVEFDEQDLTSVLLANELGVEYFGGRKNYDWCNEDQAIISVRHDSHGVLPPKVSGVYIWPPPPVQQEKPSEQ